MSKVPTQEAQKEKVMTSEPKIIVEENERLVPDDGVTSCPFCGSTDLMLNMVEWEARSLDPSDSANQCKFQEHHCESCIKSFWT